MHRGFVDQESAANLLYRKAGNDAECKRDLLRCRQVGMAADEQQSQNVVAVGFAVYPLGEQYLNIIRTSERFLGGKRLQAETTDPSPHLTRGDAGALSVIAVIGPATSPIR